MGTRVLEISPWEESLAGHIYDEPEVTRTDFLAPLPDEYKGTFDAVLVNGVLQRIGYMSAMQSIVSWIACLREDGELHVIVPSLEWACREILSENPSPAAMVTLYGGQGGDGSVHMSGYTMRLLRAHFERCGLKVTKARTSNTSIGIGGKEYEFMQHYVCGVNGNPGLQKE